MSKVKKQPSFKAYAAMWIAIIAAYAVWMIAFMRKIVLVNYATVEERTVDGITHAHAYGSTHTHADDTVHTHASGSVHTHAHSSTHTHPHHHENTKAVLNRMNRAIGHMEAVRTMIEDDRDCSEVLVQIAAVRSAINNIGKIILEDHISHCLVDAVETGDEQVIRDLNDAIDKFVK